MKKQPRWIKNFLNLSLKSKFAFTLAEILVALTIIGVISVLTIPGLMQNNQSQQTKTKAKKAFNTLNQALDMCYHGDFPYSQGSNDVYTGIYNCLAKKLNVKYFVHWDTTNGWQDKTFTAPTVIDDQIETWIVTNDGFAFKPKVLPVACVDALTINSQTSTADAVTNNAITILVDTNIEKGPDKYCEDSVSLKKISCDKFYFPVDNTGYVVAGNAESTVTGKIMDE